MSSALPPYTGPGVVCPKCGGEGADTEYRAHGTCLHSPTDDVIGLNPNERLHRTCGTCGYAWDEAVQNTPHTTVEEG
ncbi:hypothetical protein OG875_05095 [Streptomyces sp. NBC_01498]|uniref:hypothetical protein n=1 Tax=Streptomyces sp. NBC_01498 TaxID=2975870 RepID=UPI002E7B4B98|nr:hypothetical protein [Streptomyces sp. NBC_01498]WTL24034.1 hypothetical protein OG875_05095 [Streptomyces sp. NBC_01498]